VIFWLKIVIRRVAKERNRTSPLRATEGGSSFATRETNKKSGDGYAANDHSNPADDPHHNTSLTRYEDGYPEDNKHEDDDDRGRGVKQNTEQIR